MTLFSMQITAPTSDILNPVLQQWNLQVSVTNEFSQVTLVHGSI